jgi:hypothetical protein
VNSGGLIEYRLDINLALRFSSCLSSHLDLRDREVSFDKVSAVAVHFRGADLQARRDFSKGSEVEAGQELSSGTRRIMHNEVMSTPRYA